MWAGVVFVLLAGVPACRGIDYSAYNYGTDKGDDQIGYYSYNDVSPVPVTTLVALNRIKKSGDNWGIRTLNPAEINNVKDVLKKMFYGDQKDSFTTPKDTIGESYTDVYDYADRKIIQNEHGMNHDHHLINAEAKQMLHKLTPERGFVGGKWISTSAVQHGSPTMAVQHWEPNRAYTLKTGQRDEDGEEVSTIAVIRMPSATAEEQQWTPSTAEELLNGFLSITENLSPSDNVQDILQSLATTDEDTNVTFSTTDSTLTTTDTTSWTTDSFILESAVQRMNYLRNTTSSEPEKDQPFDDIEKTTTPATKDLPTSTGSSTTAASSNTTETTGVTTTMPTTTTPTTTMRITTTKSPIMDINAIIAIIANLTYDYDWNLTEEFNLTLIKYGVPTCPTTSTPTTTTTTPVPYDFTNSSVISKCFVCGLTSLQIPHNAHCSDAFAGDFLPLIPVDPRARGHIASFRKYCRFLDVHNFVQNLSEPRSIYGRFTGGCGVRWTDLSGVYTQRTCRNRFRPLMGKHFASKRMAKLELALTNVENGCIISPMASLLPLSRGVSLYARFHACVCTGNWCNRTVRIQQWKLYLTILWYWLTNKII